MECMCKVKKIEVLCEAGPNAMRKDATHAFLIPPSPNQISLAFFYRIHLRPFTVAATR